MGPEGEVPELEGWIDTDLSGVLKDVSCDGFAVDSVLCHTVLIDAHGCQHGQCTGIDSIVSQETSGLLLCSSIGNNADDDFSPSFFAPDFRSVARTQMRNVLHDSVHGSGEQNFIFIIQCDDNKQFRRSGLFIEDLTKRELFLFEVGRITCRSGISHMRELTILLVG